MNKLRRKIFFKQLKVQITSYYLVVSLLMVFIMSLVYYYSSSSIILEDALQATQYAVDQSGHDLEAYLSELKASSVYISENPSVKAYLSQPNPEDEAKIRDIIDQTLKTNLSIVSVVLVGKEGQVLSNEEKLEMNVSNNMMDQAWYVKAIDNQQMPALSSARLQEFTMDKETWVIALSQEIFDDQGHNLGVVLLDIRYQVLESYLDHLPLGEAGLTYIVDAYGHMVYHPDPKYFVDQAMKEALLDHTLNQQGYNSRDQELVHAYQISGSEWTLVGLSSLDRLDTLRRQLFEVVLLVAGIIILFVLVGGYIIASRITKPILILEHAMTQFNSLKEGIQEPKGCYEVESLTRQFNKMLDQIGALLIEVKEKEQYLRDYELKALYSQINPHFLYNTLDTIVWMAEFNDSQKVIEVTKSLAQFFRISLSNGQEMISLENEFDHIGQYLFIQKQRYDDQLTYHINLEPGLKDLMVPKIILQPLVENAIYHGIREQEGGGQVWVEASGSPDDLTLLVRDDGVGFDQSNQSIKSVKLGGVGLENVKNRLDLIYKDQVTMTTVSNPGQGTQVIIRIRQM